jgi:phosphoribosylformylglycinamidine cyclo-ligase/phosphoribosylamine--glycine ligase/phosphoribosylformylglycinamidine cyclo-ligase
MGLVKTELDDLTYHVNGTAMKVYHELRAGHREAVYQRRLAECLAQEGISVETEKRVEVYADSDLLGFLFLDLWVEQCLVVECKALSHALTNKEIGQVLTYLAATGSPVGMIYNFGGSSLEYKRILPPRRQQEWQNHLMRCIWTPPGQSIPSDTVAQHPLRFSVVSLPPPVPPLASQPGAAPSFPSPLPAAISVDKSASVRLSALESVDGSVDEPDDQSASVRLSVSKSVDGSVDQSVDIPSDSYASSGVSIEAGNRAVSLMSQAVRSTYGPEVLAGIGAFGGLYDAGALQSMDRPALVASIDGVGTKVKLAAQAGRYASIGMDIVNHCINDILVQGASPLFFLDYFATSQLKPAVVAEIVGGMAQACRQAGCALLGGETAEMPGVYAPGEFDVAGAIVGVVERGRMLPRSGIAPGDVLVGLRSSGPHTNGYSLIRRVFAEVSLDTHFAELGETLGEALLRPHRSYLGLLHCLLAREELGIKALAHLTGGGFIENIPRVLPAGLDARVRLGSWPVLPVFQLIQRQGEVAEAEMYRVFNMGIGMVLVVAPHCIAELQHRLEEESWVIGELAPGEQKVRLV